MWNAKMLIILDDHCNFKLSQSTLYSSVTHTQRLKTKVHCPKSLVPVFIRARADDGEGGKVYIYQHKIPAKGLASIDTQLNQPKYDKASVSVHQSITNMK